MSARDTQMTLNNRSPSSFRWGTKRETLLTNGNRKNGDMYDLLFGEMKVAKTFPSQLCCVGIRIISYI